MDDEEDDLFVTQEFSSTTVSYFETDAATVTDNLDNVNDNVDDEDQSPTTSVMFVSISFIVLMMISLAWLVFYYVQRFRYLHAKDRLSRELNNAAERALSKIPIRNVKTSDKEVTEADCCAVCIEPFKATDIARLLPCRHEFHKDCVDPWLLANRTCPMCKMDILRHYGYIFTGSQESIVNMELDHPVISGLRASIRRSIRRSSTIRRSSSIRLPHRNHSTVLSAPNSPPTPSTPSHQPSGSLAVPTGSDSGSALRRYWSWPRPRSSSAAAAAAARNPSPPPALTTAAATAATTAAAAATATTAAAASSSTAETAPHTETASRAALPDEVVVTPIEVEECDTSSRVLIVETYCVI